MDEASVASATVRYSTVAIVLHWLIAALLIFEVGLGLRMEAARGSAKFAVFQLHKSVGITILLLVALRIISRFFRKPPAIEAKGLPIDRPNWFGTHTKTIPDGTVLQ